MKKPCFFIYPPPYPLSFLILLSVPIFLLSYLAILAAYRVISAEER